jgi:hypothetical protein
LEKPCTTSAAQKKSWTFKYPFVWYNAFYLADVLTRFDFLKEDEVVKELMTWIINSQDKQGRFNPTSIFMELQTLGFFRQERTFSLDYLSILPDLKAKF